MVSIFMWGYKKCGYDVFDVNDVIDVIFIPIH
jgi:hypothetical protein